MATEMRRISVGVAAVSVAAMWVWAQRVEAQLDRASAVVESPAISLAAPDTAQAVDVNPAALPFLPSWSLAYVHADTGNGARFATEGDAVYAATPLILGAAVGISAE